MKTSFPNEIMALMCGHGFETLINILWSLQVTFMNHESFMNVTLFFSNTSEHLQCVPNRRLLDSFAAITCISVRKSECN